MIPELIEKYGNRIRFRVCGLCWSGDQLLMVNHSGITRGDFWAPPGGGVEFGQTAHDSLVREFLEETRIKVAIGGFKFACELLKQPLHAVEVFFEVFHIEGEVGQGIDPESDSNQQIIKECRYVNFEEIMAYSEDERHGIFRLVKTSEELKELNGFYRI